MELLKKRVQRISVDLRKTLSILHLGQRNLVKAVFVDKKKYLALMAHRRYGKDFVSVIIMFIAAILYPGNYYIFAPFFRQAKEIVVDGKTLTGLPLIDTIFHRKLLLNPKSKFVVNRSDWSITLFNKSKIFIRGADDANSNVGVGARGIIFTEAAMMKPGFYHYMKPAVDAVINKTGFGFVIFISTPRGRHNWFTQLFIDYFKKYADKPKIKKRWYLDIQKASTSKTCNGKPVMSKEDRELALLESTEEMYNQEFECAINAFTIGAWYSKQLKQAFEDKRIGRFGNYEEIIANGKVKRIYTGYCWTSQPVYICWDLGIGDRTVLWFFQKNPYNGRMRLIHHYRASGQGAEHMVLYQRKWLKERGFTRKPLNILPHDGNNREFLTATKRSDYLRDEFGLDVFTLSKEELAKKDLTSLIAQIDVVRGMFKYIEIDNEECAEGVIKLSEYVKKYNPNTREYIDIPDHNANDKASDDADSFRTGVIYFKLYLFNEDSEDLTNYRTNGEAITYYDEDYDDMFDDDY